MAPRLSFVLVVHGEQAYLQECTASLLGQDVDDVELIAVDDASPDHGPGLLDELAAGDPRVRVRHLESRVGLGEARNLGLEEATGDYVWFVQTTDVLRPGALPSIARRLRSGEPDVLLVHHSRTDALGRRRQGPHRRLLASIADAGTVTLEQRPAVAEAAPRLWDKVFRRGLLGELGARFGPRGHSELTVTWPALLAAERITASPTVGYIRRRPANAVRDRFTEGSTFDVFAAYDAVLADTPPERRRFVVSAMLRHQLRLLRNTPASEREAFFHRMAAAHRTHGGGELAGRLGQLRTTLVQRDGYQAFRLLDGAVDAGRAVQRRRAAVSRMRGRATAKARRLELERHYRTQLDEPVDSKLAVYAAYWYRGYSCNPRAIYERARELAPDVRGVWVVRRDAVASIPPGVEHVVEGTREYYDVLARAGTFINNVNYPNFLVKREGTVHVMTHHGTPLKRMGLDLQGHPVTGKRMDFKALLRRCERWDYSISSNPFSTLVWERVYPTRYETLEVGYPRNDVLANASEDDVRRAREALGVEPGQTAVLYAPTHREYQIDYAPVLDLAAVVEGLGPDHVVLARLHYLYGADPLLRRLHREGRLRDVAAHPSVEELCLAADVLVTDYSSIMFDYAVLDRPIVVHAPDWEAYRTLRGTYFDLMAEPPGVITRTEGELIDAFRSRRAWEADSERAAFRARFCSLEDGRAADRVVRTLWLGERDAAAERVPSLAR
jgi:CDP-glycerol glycerophosphotransferase